MKKLFILVLFALLSSCTNERLAMQALGPYNFVDVEFTGYDRKACDICDIYHTGFLAEKFNGEMIYGVVCTKMNSYGYFSRVTFPNKDKNEQ